MFQSLISVNCLVVPGPADHSRLGDQRAAAAEVVGQTVEHAVVGGVPCPPQPVALVVERRRRSLLFVNAGDVDSGDAVDRALDPVAFSVVDEAGASPCAGDGGEPVLPVIGLPTAVVGTAD